jgi:beta-xylosidase
MGALSRLGGRALFATGRVIVGLAAAALLTGAAPLAGNPIVRDQFLADPAARVFNGRVYVYATNDSGNDGKYWNSSDWRALSSTDLIHWTDHGSVASIAVFPWARGMAWAPDVIAHDGAYFLFAPVDRTKIGVARATSPTGPFVDHVGGPLVDNARDANAGVEPIDPTVFTDRDGVTYLAFGTRKPKIVKLSADLKKLAGPIQDIQIKGTPAGMPYGEAPWLHRRGKTYYLSYSTGWPGEIVYATADRPTGPYTWRGRILRRMNTFTNHQAIVDFRGRSYLFYHNNGLPGGSDYKRSINVDRLDYGPRGEILDVTPTGGGAAPGMAAVENPAR